MKTMALIRKLFDYDYWANREALASLSSVDGVAERPLQLFAHVVGAERIWLARVNQEDWTSTPPWPPLTREECQAAIEELRAQWTALLEKLTAESLNGYVVYRNSKGVEFRTPLQDILMHLVIHSAYHRGQVATAIREVSGKPAATDYVVFVRQSEQLKSHG